MEKFEEVFVAVTTSYVPIIVMKSLTSFLAIGKSKLFFYTCESSDFEASFAGD